MSVCVCVWEDLRERKPVPRNLMALSLLLRQLCHRGALPCEATASLSHSTGLHPSNPLHSFSSHSTPLSITPSRFNDLSRRCRKLTFFKQPWKELLSINCCIVVALLYCCGVVVLLWRCCIVVALLYCCGVVALLWCCCVGVVVLLM